ncbi:hypothetical protein K491DRAFT_722983 [Lophiostoma macrostomum CBS 122681]|uniref:DUF8021 domain-containing protein n=1 Tax=Lophiostoma macrostomum CBS 122681 TaxID=1314788 RepID=A0A6A6SK43_9PLEO|nr:hypothetical protein K491DRAFT_722983 [Lophiostoma macrostomum CBS 122681]
MHRQLPLLSLPLLTPSVLADCTRLTLQIVANTYLSSQLSGVPSPTYSAIPYIQNNVPLPITSNSSILTTPLSITHVKTTYDTQACATYIELISTDPAPGYVIGTQIHFDNAANAPSLVDSVVTTQGDWLFNASRSLEIVLDEDWNALPDDRPRADRSQLKAAVDAYLDLWGNPAADVPWGTPCRRMEGSAYTGTGAGNDSCDVGIPGGVQERVVDRRYVVDEVMGSASVLSRFGAMGGAPDSHEVRVEGAAGGRGRLRFVHTMTVMRNETAGVGFGMERV